MTKLIAVCSGTMRSYRYLIHLHYNGYVLDIKVNTSSLQKRVLGVSSWFTPTLESTGDVPESPPMLR